MLKLSSLHLNRYQRELAALTAYLALLLFVGVIAPSFFNAANWRDLAVTNAPVLLVAIGMTMVIVVGQIDISIGSQFAVCSMLAGGLAKLGIPTPLLLLVVPLIGALGETRAHDTRSLLRFDLGTLGFSAGQILNARLNLFALPGLPPFDNPTTSKPITTELHRVTQAWGKTTVTWETQPTVAVTFSSTVQEGVNQWVSFDVTGLVQDWLSDPTTNFGVELVV